MITRRLAATLALLLVTPACEKKAVEKADRLSGVDSRLLASRPPRTDLQVAEGWLQCIDCQGSYLAELKALPAVRQDSVVRFLSSALLNGPDSAHSSLIDRQLLRTWRANSAYVVRHGEKAPDNAKDFVNHYRRSVNVIWRSRAAASLGVLRTPTALQALDSAHRLPLDSIFGSDSTISRAVRWALADTARKGLPGEGPKDSVASKGSVQKAPTCQEVAAKPDSYLQTQVSWIGVKRADYQTTVEGREVKVFVFSCSDSLGHVQADTSYFAFDGKVAKTDHDPDTKVAQKVIGKVHLALELALGQGHKKRLMPYLAEVYLRVP